jgi:hypothetical protein
MKMMWRKSENNQRRGEWNALLLVMFALLTVAPSVLAAAPMQGWQGASQPQAMWQWLSECGMPNAECGITSAPCEILRAQCAPHYEIEAPQIAGASDSLSTLLEIQQPIPQVALAGPQKFRIPFSAFRTLHEAAFVSGTRTNRWME